MSDWKTDNYSFVGKAFDYAYDQRMKKMRTIVSESDTNSASYILEGLGGYGEYLPYDGTDLNISRQRRGFATVISPEQFNMTVDIHRKQAKNDLLGETRKVGQRLGYGGAMSVYMKIIRTLGGAFDGMVGGDGKTWAATDHPVASKGGADATYEVDTEAGTFSNLHTKSFSVEAITEAQSMANRFVTPDGLPFLCNMDLCLISPELEGKAKQFFGEHAKLTPERLPGGALNDANPVADMSYMVIGGGDAGFTGEQWAVCDRTLLKEIFCVVYNNRPEVLQAELDNPLIDRYVGYIDYAVGWGDARPIVFSNNN
ncbi:MAG: hypothetical protein IJC53_06790 [Clostridia bacterium]|nr:hypothetical protein [Clostridia bacterium]